MKKIPSVFLRNPENMRELTHEVNPLAQWVVDGEGAPTRKYDGTCVMLDECGNWWARREVKSGKTPPPNWMEIDVDLVTEKRMGWEPIEQSGYRKQLEEVTHVNEGWSIPWLPGTYELCGPKVGSNAEGLDRHILYRHVDAEVLRNYRGVVVTEPVFEKFKELMLDTVGAFYGWEGIVWHHPDGRMAKLKVRDFK